ncbi:MAG: hypothetical protein OEX76_01050 [Candidatus Bathyarchaeota archaeon]|nr:hypothetical protein [Candidatus Bathyarchaeota archaeon]MDH5532302.1 hypothetical protein [Candidatus Bathyarchaeota archaeon]MDH5713656.1 hypothetical protein [Candidatus Bathyarchaeota archaeon]
MSEALIPIAYQLGIGGIGGFFVGYVVRKVVRIAIIIGIFVFSLIYLAYSNVINVDYDELIGFTSITEPALGLFAPLISALPFLGSFFLGVAYGLKKG